MRLTILGLVAITALTGCEPAVTIGDGTIDIPVGGDTADQGTDDNSSDGPSRESNGTGGDDDSDGDSNESSDTSIWCLDADDDGYGDGSEAVSATSVSNGYVADCTDCNDDSSSVHPGASDTTADGVDQDCNGTDATTSTVYTWYDDDDGDGYGDASDKTTNSSSTAPTGYVSNSADCDDTNSAINPGKSEVAGNGLNDDCSSTTSDTASTSLAREMCVISSTSDYKIGYYDEGTSDRTNWVTEVSSTATVVSPILTGVSGSTGCVGITLTKVGTMVCFNGYGAASRLWGNYLVGANPGSGTFAYSNSSAASEVKLTIDATVNGSSDSSAEAVTFDGYDNCWTD